MQYESKEGWVSIWIEDVDHEEHEIPYDEDRWETSSFRSDRSVQRLLGAFSFGASFDEAGARAALALGIEEASGAKLAFDLRVHGEPTENFEDSYEAFIGSFQYSIHACMRNRATAFRGQLTDGLRAAGALTPETEALVEALGQGCDDVVTGRGSTLRDVLGTDSPDVNIVFAPSCVEIMARRWTAANNVERADLLAAIVEMDRSPYGAPEEHPQWGNWFRSISGGGLRLYVGVNRRTIIHVETQFS